ncbi:hypothetical protein UlMin_000989 [Ulmus minor]
MKKKGSGSRTRNPSTRGRTRRQSAAELLETPSPAASTPYLSPKSTIFNNTNTKKRQKAIGSSATALFKSPSRPSKTLGSISDLKEMASSHLDDLKRHIDRSHTEILKEIDASYCRLHKRVKIQNQSCQQVSDETEKEYKKMSERISETQEALMNSYVEFMVDVQASTSHACKSSITKLTQSAEKAVDGLRSRYGISSA